MMRAWKHWVSMPALILAGLAVACGGAKSELNGETLAVADEAQPETDAPDLAQELAPMLAADGTLRPDCELLQGLELEQEDLPLVPNAGATRRYRSQSGKVSMYWQPQKMANGERFDPEELVGAHTRFPIGSIVRCTNNENGKSVVVVIKDRGPFVDGRILDLSKAAAREIGLTKREGIVPCGVTVLAYPAKVAEKKDKT